LDVGVSVRFIERYQFDTEVSMPVSTRSFSLALVRVVMASLFLTPTAAHAQSQFVTVNFQGHVTAVNPGVNWPANVAVGDVVTGFFVYDLTKSADSAPTNPGFGRYRAAVCAGFTADGITVTARTTTALEFNDVEIVNDEKNFFSGDVRDSFSMGLLQNKTISQLLKPLVSYNFDAFGLTVSTTSSDPDLNPGTLTSDLMQVMPTVGWDNLSFGWGSGIGSGGIQVEDGLQISVVVGSPPACALTYGTNAVARHDFDADQWADLVVFRPAFGNWYVRTLSHGYSSITPDYSPVYQWGLPDDIPMAGDFDGDGKADLAVWRPSDGTWYIRYSSLDYSLATFSQFQWGLPGDVPVSGDFDGDGKTDLAVWRPSNGTWYIRYSSSGYSLATFGQYQWGLPGDVPVSGDFDGDRRTDLAVWRPSNGTWYIRYSSLGYSVANASQYQWGLPGDVPVSGDFEGDGKTDLVVFRPSIGGWFLRFSSAGYSINSSAYYQWGLPGDQPLALDFDGDGASDLVVFRPDTGEWYILFSSLDFSATNYNYGHTQWGLPGDLIPR
jgi:hypothetical protein